MHGKDSAHLEVGKKAQDVVLHTRWVLSFLAAPSRLAKHLSIAVVPFNTIDNPKMTSGSSGHRRRKSMDIVDAKVAVDLATAQTYSENVFLFVPNIIGKLVARICRLQELTLR
jgi:hypothetical protein